MWLSKEICESKGESTKADIGPINGIIGDTVTVQGKQEYREIPLSLPFGIVAIPKEGTKGVVIPTENGYVCSGTIPDNIELDPGEVMLYSWGGASIILKNNGQVLINGTAY